MKSVLFTTTVFIASCVLTGCGHEGNNVPVPHLVSNPLADNIYIQPPFEGARNMSLDVASFRLRSRCLEVVWNNRLFTPVFELPVDKVLVTNEKVTLPYITLVFGEHYSLQGPLVPTRISADVKEGCPQETLLVGGVAALENIPKPVTPPASPTKGASERRSAASVKTDRGR